MSDQANPIRPLDEEALNILVPRLAAAIARWDRAVKDVGKEIDALVDLFPDVDADLWWDQLVDTNELQAHRAAKLIVVIAQIVADYRKGNRRNG